MWFPVSSYLCFVLLQFFLQLQYYKSYHDKETESICHINVSKTPNSKQLDTMDGSVFDGMIEVSQHQSLPLQYQLRDCSLLMWFCIFPHHLPFSSQYITGGDML